MIKAIVRNTDSGVIVNEFKECAISNPESDAIQYMRREGLDRYKNFIIEMIDTQGGINGRGEIYKRISPIFLTGEFEEFRPINS